MKLSLQVEQLESRLTPAVNVGFNNGVLSITAPKFDGGDDVVQIFGSGPNNLVTNVRVNGVNRGSFAIVEAIKVRMGYGEDEVHLSSIRLQGNVDIQMDPSDAGDNHEEVTIDCDKGYNDLGTRSHVYVGGNLKIDVGPDHEDYLGMFTDGSRNLGIQVIKSLTILGAEEIDMFGRAGGTSQFEQADINIVGNLNISGAVEADEEPDVDLYNVNVGGKTNITLTEDSDHIRIRNCHTVGEVNLNTLGGYDFIELLGDDPNARNWFEKKVTVDGGPDGADAFVQDVNLFFGGLSTKNVFFV